MSKIEKVISESDTETSDLSSELSNQLSDDLSENDTESDIADVEEETDINDELDINIDEELETDTIGKKDESCAYNYTENKEEDIQDISVIFDDDSKIYSGIVKPEERITKNYLTKYERVRITGDRSKQLSLGAKPMVKSDITLSSKYTAEYELKNGVIPYKIHRRLPNGKIEEWKINELIINN
jgi:DNA-directed RNA polymerase I, II, and III subunit RPABC2